MEQVRRRKTASERRAQRVRAEGRRLQHALIALQEVHNHRGGRLTRFGHALHAALLNSQATDQPPANFAAAAADSLEANPVVNGPVHDAEFEASASTAFLCEQQAAAPDWEQQVPTSPPTSTPQPDVLASFIGAGSDRSFVADNGLIYGDATPQTDWK